MTENLQDVLLALYNTVNYKTDWHVYSKYQFKQALDTLYEFYEGKITDDRAYQKLDDLGFDMVPIPLGFQKTNIECSESI